MLFSLELISNSHTSLFHVYLGVSPHLLRVFFPSGISQPLPFGAPPCCPSRCPGEALLPPCPSLPLAWGRHACWGGSQGDSRLVRHPGVPAGWESDAQCLKGCSTVSALHPHLNLLLERSSPMELVELLSAPF